MQNLLITKYYQTEDYFFRSISKDSLQFDDQATAYHSGVNAESLNIVYIRKNTPRIGEILSKCKNYFHANHVPWTIIVTEAFISDDLSHAISSIGFVPTGKSAAMFLDLKSHTKTEIANNAAIEPVDNKLELWMLPLIGAFDSTYEISRQYADIHERALRNKANFHHFTFFKDNHAVSSLTLSILGDATRIDDVGTLPEAQNRGYATQLMQYAISKAIDLGASYCFLEASESGLSVYEKIGFMPLFKNQTYSMSDF